MMGSIFDHVLVTRFGRFAFRGVTAKIDHAAIVLDLSAPSLSLLAPRNADEAR